MEKYVVIPLIDPLLASHMLKLCSKFQPNIYENLESDHVMIAILICLLGQSLMCMCIVVRVVRVVHMHLSTKPTS